MDRITWEGDRAVMTGYLLGEAEKYKTKTRVFEIGYGHGGDLAGPGRYYVAHRLPFRGIERHFGTAKEAQKHCERYLVWAFRLMGFAPIEDSE